MKKYGSYLKKPFACVFFLALMLISFTAFGATIRVPADYATIQAGIDAATNGDIVLVANGTYTGAGNKNLDFKGKAITVRSENGPENTVIELMMTEPANIEQGKIFSIYLAELPVYPVLMNLELRESINGILRTIISLKHPGGVIGIPYIIDENAQVVLFVDGEQY